jgi:hypothetical protein
LKTTGASGPSESLVGWVNPTRAPATVAPAVLAGTAGFAIGETALGTSVVVERVDVSATAGGAAAEPVAGPAVVLGRLAERGAVVDARGTTSGGATGVVGVRYVSRSLVAASSELDRDAGSRNRCASPAKISSTVPTVTPIAAVKRDAFGAGNRVTVESHQGRLEICGSFRPAFTPY